MRPRRVRTAISSWRTRHTTLALCIGSYFAVRFAQVVVGPVVPEVIGTFRVSRGAVGAALTGMWVAYALVQLPSGVVADRIGERRVVLVALGITAGATIALAGSPTFLLFGAGAVALGIGAGIYYNPATALLADAFDGVGGAIGTHRIGGQAAGVVAPVAATVVGVRYGWRATIALGAVLAVVAAGAFARQGSTTVRESRPVSPGDRSSLLALTTLLARSHTRYTTVVATIVEFVGLAVMAFLPIFLVEHFGLSSRWANLSFALFFAVTAVAQPVGGRLSDAIGRDATIASQTAAGVLGFAALAVGDSRILAILGVVLAGIAVSSTAVVQSRMIDGLSAANRGTGFGLFRTLYLLGGATGTTVVGTTADVAGWGVAFGLLAALLAPIPLSLAAIRIAGDGASALR